MFLCLHVLWGKPMNHVTPGLFFHQALLGINVGPIISLKLPDFCVNNSKLCMLYFHYSCNKLGQLVNSSLLRALTISLPFGITSANHQSFCAVKHLTLSKTFPRRKI
jgi:hypothetical protein